MNGLQGLKRQLLSLLKGLPIIIGCAVVALVIAKKIISYTPNTYQTVARIKLDDQKYGFSNTQLYKDIDVFATTSKIQSEAEILQSPLLIGKGLERVDFGVSIYRIGSLKNTLLYKNSPIIIKHQLTKTKNLDQTYWINIVDKNHYQLGKLENEIDTANSEIIPLGMPALVNGETITVFKNDSLLNEKELHLIGLYECTVFSKNGLIADVAEKLNVAAIDKEIPVLRVVYKDQNAQKVADMANAICHAYIEDYVATKTGAASQTVKFLETKIQEVSKELQQAEVKLEEYKSVNGVVNTRQETETGLRKQSNLEVQLINLEMNEQAINELEQYMTEGDYFSETAINFGFGDLLMTELVKKLKSYQDERQDMIYKYTAESNQVKALDTKIAELKNYIREAIKRNKKEIITKRESIEKMVDLNSKQFDGLSTREKEMRVLERDFAMKEQVYTFLAQKKIEASIAASALLSFHRIIQPAVTPKKPVSPNKTLLVFVSGLLGLIVGTTYVYLRKATLSKVVAREDLEKHSELPILGVVRKKNSGKDFSTLAKALKFKDKLENHPLLTVSSAINGEGRSYVSKHLAQSISDLGYSVGLIKIQENENHSGESISDFLTTPSEFKGGVCSLISLPKETLKASELMKQLKAHFDVIIVDTPAAALSIEGVEFMKLANLNLFLFRANYTSTDFLEYPELLAEEYKIKNIHLILNSAHMASSFNGRFVGTRYNTDLNQEHFTSKIWNYITAYIGS
ncbi:MAG: exopolysaccharide transport family protein [Salibacteraceae bacterium]